MAAIVLARSWSRETWRPLTPMRLPAVELWVHHGATGDSTLATLRAYDRYHVTHHRWAALGYSYAITGDGTVYEGRGRHVGAHTSGRNSVAFGVCLVGDLTTRDATDAQVRSLAALVRHLADTGALTRPVITGGHRQAPGATTACPGAGGLRAIEDARRLLAAPTPPPTPPPPAPDPVEDDMLVRIDSTSTVYHVVGDGLLPLSSAVQAEVIAGPDWRDHVKTLTAEQAQAFHVGRLHDIDDRRVGAVEIADRVGQGLAATRSTPLGLGRWSGPVVRWARAQGADLTKHETP